MIKSTKTLQEVKNSISNMQKKNVSVTLNLGRNKLVSFKGRVEGVYPALFTVCPIDDFKGKTTYSYSEYLCGRVKLKELTSVNQN